MQKIESELKNNTTKYNEKKNKNSYKNDLNEFKTPSPIKSKKENFQNIPLTKSNIQSKIYSKINNISKITTPLSFEGTKPNTNFLSNDTTFSNSNQNKPKTNSFILPNSLQKNLFPTNSNDKQLIKVNEEENSSFDSKKNKKNLNFSPFVFDSQSNSIKNSYINNNSNNINKNVSQEKNSKNSISSSSDSSSFLNQDSKKENQNFESKIPYIYNNSGKPSLSLAESRTKLQEKREFFRTILKNEYELIEKQKELLPVPEEKKNDEKYKLLKIKQLKKKSIPDNQSAKKPNESLYNKPFKNSFDKINQFGLLRSKKVAYSNQTKNIKLQIEMFKEDTEVSFPMYRDNDIGFYEYWQIPLKENKIDEDVSSDEDQIVLAQKICKLDIKEAMDLLKKDGEKKSINDFKYIFNKSESESGESFDEDSNEQEKEKNTITLGELAIDKLEEKFEQ